MRRVIVYPGSGAQDTDILRLQNYIKRSINGLAWAVFGGFAVNSGVAASGLGPISYSGLSLTVGPGVLIGKWQVEDAAAFGSLPASSAGNTPLSVNPAPTVLGPFPAPTVAGQAINYLVTGILTVTDTDNQVLYYQNPTYPNDPTQVFRGVGNNGSPQPTTRSQSITFNITPGVAAAGGTQTTPATPTDNIVLFVVTVYYGTTILNSANVSYPTNSAYLMASLPKLAQDFSAVVGSAGYAPVDDTSNVQLLNSLRYLLVQKGSGIGQQIGNAVKIGWSAISKLLATVDATNLGPIAFESWTDTYYTPRTNNFQHYLIYGSNNSFTVPAGVTVINVKLQGGGGAGGACASTGTVYAGGGGASGGFAEFNLAVTPGTVYNIIIGAAGTPAGSGFTSGTGGDTIFTNASTSVVVATANGGGGGGSKSTTSAGGIGGSASLGSGVSGLTSKGSDGGDGQDIAISGITIYGGNGGSSRFGGAGRAGSGGGLGGAQGSGGGGAWGPNGVGGYGGGGICEVRY